MPARRIDTAYVEIGADFSELDRAQREIERHLAGLARSVDDTADDIDSSFRDLTDDTERFFEELEREVDASFDEMARSADDTADDVARDMQRAGERSEDAFEELSRTARREFDQIDRAATATAASTKAKFSAMGVAAGAALAGIGLAVTAGLGAIAGFGLVMAAQLEQTQISFNALLGSVEEGERVFRELQNFAATTPFEFPEVANAAKRFLAFNDAVGISDDFLQEFLTIVGDLSSVTGAGAEGLNRITLAIGQIASKGKVSLEELMQIGEAVPGFSAIGAIAQSMGITTAEAMEQISRGAVDAQTGIAALLDGMRQFPGAAGAMEDQSQTLLGVFSTFKDTIGIALADAFTPIIPAIKDSLTAITPVIEESLSELAPALGGLLASALPLLADALQFLTPILTPILDGLSMFAESIGPALAPLGDAFGEIFVALQPLMPILGEIFTDLLVALTPVVVALVEALVPLVGPITDILIALMPLIDPLAQLLVVVVDLVAPFIELTAILASLIANEALVPVVEALAFALEEVAGWLEPVTEFLGDIDWADLGEDIGGAFVTAWNAVSDFFAGVFNWFRELPGRITGFIRSIPSRLINVFKTAMQGVLAAIGVGLAVVYLTIAEAPGRIMDFLKSLPERITNLFNTVRERAVNAVTALGTWLFNFARELPGRFIGAMISFTSTLANFFRDAFDRAKTNVRNGIDAMVQFVRDLPGRIAGFSQTIASNIVSFFKNALNSAINAINQGIAFVDDKMPFVSIPRIPNLAHGGIAFGPAVIGEDASTSPEVALPLGDPAAMSMLVDALERAGGGDVGGNNFTVIVEIDGQQLQGRIVRVVEERDRTTVRRVTQGSMR